ncbi:MAG: hypothetical protein AABX84_02670, partial [Nanoarchaeota archaeon]
QAHTSPVQHLQMSEDKTYSHELFSFNLWLVYFFRITAGFGAPFFIVIKAPSYRPARIFIITKIFFH